MGALSTALGQLRLNSLALRLNADANIQLDQGFWVSINGVPYPEHVQRNLSITRGAGVVSTVSGTLIAGEGELPDVPTEGHEIIVRAGHSQGIVLFGGYLDEPKIILRPGDARLYDIDLQGLGWRSRLDEVPLTQPQGVAIAGMTSGSAQARTLIGYLAAEGFTADINFADPEKSFGGDARFLTIGEILDEIAQLNDTVVVVSANKVVSLISRSLTASAVTLTGENIEQISLDFDRQNYRTGHIIRYGRLSRIQSLAGRADGRYRIGGVQAAEQQRSLFDAPLGNGKLWEDFRGRGGTDRGSDTLAELIKIEDLAVLPTTAVVGSDRTIDKLTLEVVEESFGALLVTSGEGVYVRTTGNGGSGSSGYSVIASNLLIPVGATRVDITALYWQNSTQLNVDLSGNRDTDAWREFADGVKIGIKLSNGTIFEASNAETEATSNLGRAWEVYFNIPECRAAIDSLSDKSITVILFRGERVTADSIGMRLEGVALASLATTALLARAFDGTEYTFNGATLAGSDNTTPYFWPRSVLGNNLNNALDVRAMILNLRTGASKLVLVDTTSPRVDLDNRILRSSSDTAEFEVTRIRDVKISGLEVSVGGAEDDWVWKENLQEIQQIRNIPASPPEIVVEWDGRRIDRATTGTVPRVEYVSIDEDVSTEAAALDSVRTLIRRHGVITQIIDATFAPGEGSHFDEGDGAKVSAELLRRLNARGATAEDVWRVDRLDISEDSGLIIYKVRLLREADESRYREVWRHLLRGSR